LVRESFISSALPEADVAGADGLAEFLAAGAVLDGAAAVLVEFLRGGAVVPVFGILFSRW
jgi:hypothetical protein